MKSLKRLSQQGFSHIELVLVIVGLVAISGVYLQIKGHADSNTSDLIKAAGTYSSQAAFKRNWSGYVAKSAKQVNSIQFSVTIPKVKCLVDNSDASIWAGIDGYTSATVEQSGVSINCSYNKQKNLVPSYYAWTDMYPAYQSPVKLTIHPLDSVIFHTYVASNGKFDFYIKDQTTNSISNTQYACGQNGGHTCKRTDAEWIVERNTFCENPTCTKSRLLALTDFGSVSLNNAYATTESGQSTPLGSYQNTPIIMTSSNWSKYLSNVNMPLKIKASSFTDHWLASQ